MMCPHCDELYDSDFNASHEACCEEKTDNMHSPLWRKVHKETHTTHDKSTSREYGIWSAMKNRCDNPSHIGYKNYGGRGIGYCYKWRNFEGFWEDMKDTYLQNLSIDRIDNDGDYCKSNCRWTTQREQSRNSRRNRKITVNGKTKILTDWLLEYNISRDTFYSRVKRGTSDLMALTTPADRKKRKASLSRKMFKDVEHEEVCKDDMEDNEKALADKAEEEYVKKVWDEKFDNPLEQVDELVKQAKELKIK